MQNEETNAATTVSEFNDSWKGRGTLQNLVTELERQRKSRIDFVADVRHLSIEANGGIKVIPPRAR